MKHALEIIARALDGLGSDADAFDLANRLLVVSANGGDDATLLWPGRPARERVFVEARAIGRRAGQRWRRAGGFGVHGLRESLMEELEPVAPEPRLSSEATAAALALGLADGLAWAYRGRWVALAADRLLDSNADAIDAAELGVVPVLPLPAVYGERVKGVGSDPERRTGGRVDYTDPGGRFGIAGEVDDGTDEGSDLPTRVLDPDAPRSDYVRLYDGDPGVHRIAPQRHAMFDHARWPVVDTVFPVVALDELGDPPDEASGRFGFGIAPGSASVDDRIRAFNALRAKCGDVLVAPELCGCAALVEAAGASESTICVLGSEHLETAGERVNRARLRLSGNGALQHVDKRNAYLHVDRDATWREGLVGERPPFVLFLAPDWSLSTFICADFIAAECVDAVALLRPRLVLVPALSARTDAFGDQARYIARRYKSLVAVANFPPVGGDDAAACSIFATPFDEPLEVHLPEPPLVVRWSVEDGARLVDAPGASWRPYSPTANSSPER